MRISLLVTPCDDHNLALAAQVGVEQIVSVYPGLQRKALKTFCKRVEGFGMKVGAVERLIPRLKFIHNEPGRDAQIDDFVTLIRNMGDCGVPVLCYSWMPDDDWQRTDLCVQDRGGSLVTEFDITRSPNVPTDTGYARSTRSRTSVDQQWKNLEYFLNRVVPVAEDAGVTLSMHPTDPPVPMLCGQPRIMIHPEEFVRMVKLVDSPANGVCFCQGTFASCEQEIDLPAWIRRLAPYINYVHFRDVVGRGNRFREAWHDNGQTDMLACMSAYYEAGIDVPIRPDHAPTMAGESNEHPGYHMLGRLFAVGYMRGLMQACESRKPDGHN